MVLVVILGVGVVGLFGVGLATLLGFGCWRWLGFWGGAGGAGVLFFAVLLGVHMIRETISQARNANERAVASMFAWAVGVPTFAALAGGLWLTKLALNR